MTGGSKFLSSLKHLIGSWQCPRPHIYVGPLQVNCVQQCICCNVNQRKFKLHWRFTCNLHPQCRLWVSLLGISRAGAIRPSLPRPFFFFVPSSTTPLGGRGSVAVVGGGCCRGSRARPSWCCTVVVRWACDEIKTKDEYWVGLQLQNWIIVCKAQFVILVVIY